MTSRLKLAALTLMVAVFASTSVAQVPPMSAAIEPSALTTPERGHVASRSDANARPEARDTQYLPSSTSGSTETDQSILMEDFFEFFRTRPPTSEIKAHHDDGSSPEHLIDYPIGVISDPDVARVVFQSYEFSKSCWHLDDQSDMCRLYDWDDESNFEHLSFAYRYLVNRGPNFEKRDLPTIMGRPHLKWSNKTDIFIGFPRQSRPGLQAYVIGVPGALGVVPILYADTDDLPTIVRSPLDKYLTTNVSALVFYKYGMGETGSLWAIIIDSVDISSEYLIKMIRFADQMTTETYREHRSEDQNQ